MQRQLSIHMMHDELCAWLAWNFSDTNLRRSDPSMERLTLSVTPSPVKHSTWSSTSSVSSAAPLSANDGSTRPYCAEDIPQELSSIAYTVAKKSSTLKFRINTFGHFQIAQNVFSYNFFGLRCKFVFYFQRFHCLQGLIVLFFLSSQNHQFPDIRTQPKPPHKHKINVSIHGCCVMGCNPFRAYLSHSKL